MGSAQPELTFAPEGLFFKMVTAYGVSVTGLLFYHQNVRLIHSDPVGFASTEYPALEIKPEEMQHLVRSGGVQLGDVTDSLAKMLLNLAYETARATYGKETWLSLRKTHPELEFFRHARNAVSHGGLWHFGKTEPSRAASWRGRNITRQLAGRSLWAARLKPGDLLILLSDVEQILGSEDSR